MDRPMDTLVLMAQRKRKEEVVATKLFMIQDPDLGPVAFQSPQEAASVKHEGDQQVPSAITFFSDVGDYGKARVSLIRTRALAKLTDEEISALGLESLVETPMPTPAA